jgi:ribosomal protein L7/L12
MIKAINVHRRRTGCGLAEAKRSCDEYLRHRDETS